MVKKIKKLKKPSRKSLIKKLDKLVSGIVRKRDGNKCVVCGSTFQLTCGHIFSRSAYSTRWDLENCHAQCWKENFNHEYDPYPFINWFIKKFGQKKLDELHKRYRTPRIWKDFDLQELYLELEKEL